jgi:hypothetical protein
LSVRFVLRLNVPVWSPPVPDPPPDVPPDPAPPPVEPPPGADALDE